MAELRIATLCWRMVMAFNNNIEMSRFDSVTFLNWMEIFMILRIGTLFILMLSQLVLASSLGAQTNPAFRANELDVNSPQQTITAQQDRAIADRLANWRGILLSTEQALSRAGLGDDELAQKLDEISAIRLKALELELQIEPQVTQIKEQLTELGPVPKEDEPGESGEITKKRKELEEKFSHSDGELKASRLVAVRSAQIERQLIENRRHRFVTQISQRSSSFFNLELWSAFWLGFEGFWHRFTLLLADSGSALKSKIDNSNFLTLILVGGFLLILYGVIFLRRMLQHWTEHILGKNSGGVRKRIDQLEDVSAQQLEKDQQELDNFTKIRLAGVSFVRNGVVPSVAILLLFYVLTIPDIMTTRLESLIFEATLVIAAAIVSIILAKSFLSPNDDFHRVVSLSQHISAKTFRIIIAGILLIALLRLINKTASILVSPLEVSIGLSAMLALVCIISLVFVLKIVATKSESEERSQIASVNLVRWRYLNPLFWLVCIFGIISLITGYIAFAEFLAWQILIAAFIFALLWLGLELLDLHRENYLDTDEGQWRNLSRATGFSRQTVLQIGVFGFGLVKLAVIVATALIFMISWGYRTGDWAGVVSEAFFGFKIGGLSISFSAIALAIMLFVAGYIVTMAIQHWLRNQFLPTTNLDPGLRNSIATVFGYAGFVLALLLAITAAGLDLSKVAIVAGALSVGIGFGLQSIVNNFVSGLILLAERPIKSGDWIVTTGGEGTVRKTSVRSTEIETFDGAVVIIPNSTLITEAVTNWTHHGQKGRIKIAIGVGYDSDPDQVRQILLECASKNGHLLKRPAPNVYFMDFGTDALMFEFRGYLADINYSLSTKSDLRFAFLRELRKSNIEIPFPQRDIHIKSAPAALTTAQQTKARPAASRTRAKRQPKKTGSAAGIPDRN